MLNLRKNDLLYNNSPEYWQEKLCVFIVLLFCFTPDYIYIYIYIYICVCVCVWERVRERISIIYLYAYVLSSMSVYSAKYWFAVRSISLSCIVRVGWPQQCPITRAVATWTCVVSCYHEEFSNYMFQRLARPSPSSLATASTFPAIAIGRVISEVWAACYPSFGIGSLRGFGTKEKHSRQSVWWKDSVKRKKKWKMEWSWEKVKGV